MLETIGKKLGTLGCRLSPNLYGYRLNNPKVVGIVSVSSNLSISGREEVGFQSSSDALGTHNSTLRRT